MKSFKQFFSEMTAPQGTTGKRQTVHMKTGPVRNAAGKIVSAPVFKSASSRGGGSSGSAGGGSGGNGD